MNTEAQRNSPSSGASGNARATDTATESTSQPVLRTPTQWELRDQLQEAIVKDLFGPAGGPLEELDEASVRDRYLVGLLAPRGQQIELEQFDRLETDDESALEDGTAESSAPVAKTLLPSSFGLTCTVSGETRRLRVTARWGQYQRIKSETVLTAAGNPKAGWASSSNSRARPRRRASA